MKTLLAALPVPAPSAVPAGARARL